MPSDTPPIVLTFGLSDPTGGSGLQADLMTLASMGCHGVSVLTGYT
ncbi:MAG TPA: bifunctional hydroxymethylpyrimidine kinase/phosphomethylpyrimidine kinase, partial [Paraburkholderia sp.]|nr:bifunctional hydroxymethylpyrimidine kinase/phosphomethylpyrimidine kinase [Paraburkholderia sp.]